MKNYLSCRSSTVCALLTLVLFMVGGCLVGKAALFRPEAANSASQRTLTFADRVSYQHAIEEVYWLHRIWPKENSRPKPSLDEVMSQQQIQQKVQEYLHNSQLLADQWQRPITPEQLQAELVHMASHTRQSEVLRELFAALGNDPFVIAECLARPILSERLANQLHAGANAPSNAECMASLAAKTEIGSATTGQPEFDYDLPQIASSPVGDPVADRVGHWNGTSATDAPDERALHTAVWTGTEMIVWGGYGGASGNLNSGGKYNPSTDSWVATSTVGAPEARRFPTAVWTGTEMIVWGGAGATSCLNSGGRYNPNTDSWVSTTTSIAPEARTNHTAVWTGHEMIVWGGGNTSGSDLNTGGKYNPNTDSWVPTTSTTAPDARHDHTAIWTGSEMIVWGGVRNFSSYLNSGARYNPTTDTWNATITSGAPTKRAGHTSVWTDTEMIVWGGGSGSTRLKTGGRYSPSTDSWIATTAIGGPPKRDSHTAVWTGSEMIVWGGFGNGNYLKTGGRYLPGTDSWTPISITAAPVARVDHTAVWTGSGMIIWGGDNSSDGYLNTGGIYSP